MFYKINLTNQKQITISGKEYEKVKEVLTKDRSRFLDIKGVLINPSYIIQIERDSEAEARAEKEENKYPTSVREGEGFKPITPQFRKKFRQDVLKTIQK